MRLNPQNVKSLVAKRMVTTRMYRKKSVSSMIIGTHIPVRSGQMAS